MIEPVFIWASLSEIAFQVRSGSAAREGEAQPGEGGVSLRQRAWPLAEMMKRARAVGEPIVWGV